MLRKGTMAYYSRLYDIFYDIGQRILDKHNPCQIKDKKCIGKVYANESFCCNGCEFLTKNGCRVKALWCKLWLCAGVLYEQKPDGSPNYAKFTIVARKLQIIKRAVHILIPGIDNIRACKKEQMLIVKSYLSKRSTRRKYREKNTRSPQNKT